MIQAPEIEPISKLARGHLATLEKVKKGPVFLTQNGSNVAVIVSTELWRRIAAELEEMRDIIDVLEADLEFAKSGGHLEEFDADEFPALSDIQASTTTRRKRTTAQAA